MKSDSSLKKYDFVFFGTDDFSVKVLEQLVKVGFIPSVIVTATDRPAGRGHKVQEPQIKTWVKNFNSENEATVTEATETKHSEIKIEQPEKIDEEFVKKISEQKWDFFVTASYGKIISKEVLDVAEKGAFNVHPSLLPLYRGASPIESAMLNDQKETGVTIMLMDEKMDHGPILNQEFVYFEEWPNKIEVENKLAEIGGHLLSETIEPYLVGEIEEQVQDHGMATFTKKITKELGEVKWNELEKSIKNPSSNLARKIFLKVQSLNPWPGAFFFIKHDNKEIRVKIKSASWITESAETDNEFGKLRIERVLPEGKKEMDFEDFMRGYIK